MKVLNSQFTYSTLSSIFLLTNIHIQTQATISHSSFSHNTGNIGKFLKTIVYLDSLSLYNNTSLDESLLHISESSTLNLNNCTFESNSQQYHKGILSITGNSNSTLTGLKLLRNEFPASDSVSLSSGQCSLSDIYIYKNNCKDSRVIYMQDVEAQVIDIQTYDNQCGIATIGISRTKIDIKDGECENETGCIDLEISNARLRDIRVYNVTNFGVKAVNSELDGEKVIMRDCKKIGISTVNCMVRMEELKMEYCGASEFVQSSFEMYHSEVSHNINPSIYLTDSEFLIKETIFRNNTFSSLILQDSYGNIFSTAFLYNSESTIRMLSGNLTIHDSLFDHNSAYQGACIYSSCDHLNCMSILNSTFSSNEAYIGAGIYYETIQPLLLQSSFINNFAEYGSDLATQASNLTLETPIVLSNLRSGSILPYIQASIRDDLEQVIFIDHDSVASIAPTDNFTILTGGDRLLSKRGLFQFDSLKVIHPPNSNTTISLIPNSSLQPIQIQLSFRSCIPGEIQILNSCELCGNNTYSLNPDDNYCLSCPREAECYGTDKMLPKDGYWRSGRFSDEFYGCPYPSACLGSNQEEMIYEGRCEVGYSGTLCSICIDRYFQYAGYRCAECPEEDHFYVLIFGAALGFLLFFTFMIWNHIRNCTKPKKQSNLMLKIVLTYLQTIRLLNIYNISWPDLLLKFFEGASIGGDSGSQILTLDCRSIHIPLLDLNRTYTKVLISSALPIVCCCVLLIFWFCVTFYKESAIYLKRHFVCSVVIVLVVLNPSVLDSSMSMIGCREIDGVKYLMRDYSIECYSESHIWMLFYIVVPTVLLYAIILPGILLLILYRNRHSLDEESIRMRYGIIYVGYKPKLWFWELCQFYRKVLLKGVLIAVAEYSAVVQATSVVIILMLVLLLQLAFKPYVHPAINALEFHSILTASLTVTLGMYFLNDNSYEFNTALAWGILLLNCFFVTLWGVIYFKMHKEFVDKFSYKLVRLLTRASSTFFRKSKSSNAKVVPFSPSDIEELHGTAIEVSFYTPSSPISETPTLDLKVPEFTPVVTFREEVLYSMNV